MINTCKWCNEARKHVETSLPADQAVQSQDKLETDKDQNSSMLRKLNLVSSQISLACLIFLWPKTSNSFTFPQSNSFVVSFWYPILVLDRNKKFESDSSFIVGVSCSIFHSDLATLECNLSLSPLN
jgi:hypothetical protein